MRFLLLLLSLLLFLSCSFIMLPEEFDVLEGENCILICDGALAREDYEELLILADAVYLSLKTSTGIDLKTKIFIYFNDLVLSDCVEGDGANGIYLNENFFIQLSTENKLYLLRHDMAHMFFKFNYGETTSYIFSEGVAEYYGYAKSECPESTCLDDQLADWIDLSFYDYFVNSRDYEEIITEIYSLSHRFIYYWSETYGERSLKELYPEITAENIMEKLEDYSHISFEEIVVDFNHWEI